MTTTQLSAALKWWDQFNLDLMLRIIEAKAIKEAAENKLKLSHIQGIDPY
jgi:hypothetical protein